MVSTWVCSLSVLLGCGKLLGLDYTFADSPASSSDGSATGGSSLGMASGGGSSMNDTTEGSGGAAAGGTSAALSSGGTTAGGTSTETSASAPGPGGAGGEGSAPAGTQDEFRCSDLTPDETGFSGQASLYFQNLTLSAPSCREVAISFDRAPLFDGRPIAHFNLYRDGELINKVVPDLTSSEPMLLRDVWFLPGTGMTHHYRVEVVNDQVHAGHSERLEYTAVPCRPVNESLVIVKLTPKDLLPPAEWAPDGTLQTLFNASDDPRSASNYFDEVSYGQARLSFEENPGWQVLDMTQAELCFGTDNLQKEGSELYCPLEKADLEDAVPAALRAELQTAWPGHNIVWVVQGLRGHAGSRDSEVWLGAQPSGEASLLAAYAALGQYHGLSTSWRIRCPGDTGFGPRLLDFPPPGMTSPEGCAIEGSQAVFDPMGGVSGHHFYAWHKLQVAWLAPCLHMVTVSTLPPGTQHTLKLKAVDDPTLGVPPGTEPRLVRYRLQPESSGSLVFEYRRAVGLNGDSFAGQPNLKSGLYASYFPGKNPALETDEHAPVPGDLLLPTEERAFTTGHPFVDPYRELVVTLDGSDDSGGVAEVTLHRVHSYTGTCRTGVDRGSVLCFCNGQLDTLTTDPSSREEFQCASPFKQWEFDDPAELNDFEHVKIQDAPPDDTSIWFFPGNGTVTQQHKSSMNMLVSPSAPEEACLETALSTGDSVWSGMLFRYTDRNNYIVFEASEGVGVARLREVESQTNAQESEPYESHVVGMADVNIDWGTITKLKLCYRGERARGYIDGALVVDGTVRSGSGRVGLYNHRNQFAAHDYFRVYPYLE